MVDDDVVHVNQHSLTPRGPPTTCHPQCHNNPATRASKTCWQRASCVARPLCQSSCSSMAEAPARTQTVHVLWEPAEGQPSCDVVFFHGLQIGSYETAWEHTWKNQQGMLWPAEWLGQQDFPTARILSISYDSEAIRGGKTMDEVARDLVYQVCMLVSEQVLCHAGNTACVVAAAVLPQAVAFGSVSFTAVWKLPLVVTTSGCALG